MQVCDRACPQAKKHAGYPVFKAVRGYFFSCLVFFFSLGVWEGFFLASFFVSRDFDMVRLRVNAKVTKNHIQSDQWLKTVS